MDRRRLLSATGVLLAALFAAGPALAAPPSDLTWTPCHRLEMGGNLQALCQECAAKGLGWRFYLSRDRSRSVCQQDPVPKGQYRLPLDTEERSTRDEATVSPPPRPETRPTRTTPVTPPTKPSHTPPPARSSATVTPAHTTTHPPQRQSTETPRGSSPTEKRAQRERDRQPERKPEKPSQ